MTPRYFAAVAKDGTVLYTTESFFRTYRHAVAHTGLRGTFVTFHSTVEGAYRAVDSMKWSLPLKELVRVVPTKYRVPYGVPLDLTPGGPVLAWAGCDPGVPDDDLYDVGEVLVQIDPAASLERETLERWWTL